MSHPADDLDADAPHEELRRILGSRQYQHETQLRAIRQGHGFDLDATLATVGRAYDRLNAALDLWRDDVRAAHARIDRRTTVGPHWAPPAQPKTPPIWAPPADA